MQFGIFDKARDLKYTTTVNRNNTTSVIILNQFDSLTAPLPYN